MDVAGHQQRQFLAALDDFSVERMGDLQQCLSVLNKMKTHQVEEASNERAALQVTDMTTYYHQLLMKSLPANASSLHFINIC